MGRNTYKKSPARPWSHRVERRANRPAVPLPRAQWSGATFVDADGSELEIVWDGHRNGPDLCGPIERAPATADCEHRLHLQRAK